jgi:hypothetical protein
MARRGKRGAGQRSADDGQRGTIVRGIPQVLGDLSGEVVEPIIASFGYFGTTIRVNPDLTETEVVDLLEQAGEVDDDGGAGMMAGLKSYVRGHIHDDDFETFWGLAKSNRQGAEAIIKVCYKILELLSERPTSRPSASADGRPVTSQSLPPSASAPVVAVPDSPSPEPDVRDELAHLAPVVGQWITRYEQEGRPDLAAQVLVTAEGKAAVLAGRTG